MSDKPNNLAEGLMYEMNRVRDMVQEYEALPGGAGRPAAMMMRMSIEMAQRASLSGDVIAIISAYEDLKGFKR